MSDLTGYFVVDGKLVVVAGEDEALACARAHLVTGEPNPGFLSGVVYWTAAGAQDELDRVNGLPTLTDVAYEMAMPPKPPGMR